MYFRPIFTNYNFVLKYCKISGFLNFHFSHLIYEKFNLCLQNTLNMSKMTRVYFGALQGPGLEREPSWCDSLHLGFHLIKQKEPRVKVVEEIKRFNV